MGRIVYTDAGLQVYRPNPEAEANPDDPFEKFEGRIPVVYSPEDRSVYTGAPNWFHGDTYAHHQIDDTGSDAQGYFGGGPSWGNGALKWWHGVPPEDHQQVAQALQQAGYHIPNPEAPPTEEFEDEDWGDEANWEDDPW